MPNRPALRRMETVMRDGGLYEPRCGIASVTPPVKFRRIHRLAKGSGNRYPLHAVKPPAVKALKYWEMPEPPETPTEPQPVTPSNPQPVTQAETWTETWTEIQPIYSGV